MGCIGVIINGGANVGVKIGDRFAVRGAPQAITDPVSGEVLREIAGQIVGEIVIEQVETQSSAGRLVYGDAKRGAVLERVQASTRLRSRSDRSGADFPQ